MPSRLRRLPPRTALSAVSRALRTTPSCSRPRAFRTTTCAYSTSAGRRTRALPGPERRFRAASHVVYPATFVAGQRRRASVVAAEAVENSAYSGGVGMVEGKTDADTANTEDIGPIQEYDRRVANGLLRNDEHQRGEGSPPAEWMRRRPKLLTPRQG